jgi:hypothetical protein
MITWEEAVERFGHDDRSFFRIIRLMLIINYGSIPALKLEIEKAKVLP